MHATPDTSAVRSGGRRRPGGGGRAVGPPRDGAGTDYHLDHRLGRGPLVRPGDRRELQESQPPEGQGRDVPARARARASGQDQGPAGRWPCRHQPRHDRPGCRLHHAGGQPAGPALPPVRQDVSQRGADRRGARVPGRRQGVPHAVRGLERRPGVHLQPGQGQDAAEDGRRVQGLDQGQPRQVHVRSPRELGAGPLGPLGTAVHPRRREPERPDGRLGEELGVPQGDRRAHRVLPDRNSPRVPAGSSPASWSGT
jgi:hypothetical protein